MNNFQNQNWNNNQNTQNQQANQQQTNSNSSNQQANNQVQPSWLMQIAGACLPVLLKQFTGQELTPPGSPSNNNAMEVSLVLSQVLTLQQQIITSQQDLTSRIVNLETRASQQFIGLAKQVQNLSAVRLTHEKKSIDYNLPHENETNQS